MKKRYVVVSALFLIIAVTVATFLVMFYLDPARALYAEGQTLRANADYGSAIEKYQTLVDKFPDSGYANEAKTSLLAECYYNWGLALGNELKYGEAVEKYQVALTYPESNLLSTSEGAMLDCYYQWGQSLQSQNNYGEALDKYQSIIEIDEYYIPNGSDTSIRETVPDCYYQWGQYLQSQKNYSGALDKYQLIIDTDSLRFYLYRSQAEEAIPQCYYEWVTQLVTTKEYDEAIQKYSVIQKEYASTVWASSEKADVLRDIPADVLFTWATKLQQEKSYDYAIKLYDALLQYNPGSQYTSQAEKARIDTEIAEIAGQEHGYLPPPSALTSQQLEGKAEYTITNDTPYTLTVLLSGPTTRSIIISTHATEIITLEPGTYKIAAKVDASSVTPYYGEDALVGDTQYEVSFYISTTYG